MKKRNILILLSVVIIGGGLFFLLGNKKSSTIESYEDITVSRGQLHITTQVTGTAKPENRLEIKPPIAGRIEEIKVKEGQTVKKGEILAWMSSTERAALLDAARAKGEKELESWEDLYRPTPIISPINGTVILKSVESGQTFTNTDAILVLSNRLTVKAEVDETDISSITVGQKAQIVLDAYADKKIQAEVTAIAYDATTVNNITIYEVDVSPLEPPLFMRSGMTANVNFIVNSEANVLIIPTAAIQYQSDTPSVLVRGQDGKPRLKPIKISLTDGKMTAVESGLKEGDTILVKQITFSEKDSSSNPFSPFGKRKRKK